MPSKALALSSISACSIVQSCILPILLYGVENWVVLPESIGKLECFQGEVAKKNSPDAKMVFQQSCLCSARIEFYPSCVRHQKVEISAPSL